MRRKYVTISNLIVEKWTDLNPVTKKDYWKEHIKNPDLCLLNHLIDEYPEIVNEEEIDIELSKLKRDQRNKRKNKATEEKEELHLRIEELEIQVQENDKYYSDEMVHIQEVNDEKYKSLEKKCKSLSRNNKSLKEKYKSLEEEVSELKLRPTLDQFNKLERELEDERKEILRCKSMGINLHAKIVAGEVRITELEDENKSFKNRLEESDRKFKLLFEENVQLKDRIEKLIIENLDMKERMEILIENDKKSRDEIKILMENNKRLDDENIDIRKNEEDLYIEIQIIKKELNTKKNELISTNNMVKLLVNEVDILKKDTK
jgi:chromosome segregation ATPase